MRYPKLATAAVLAALVLGACSDDGDEEPPATQDPATLEILSASPLEDIVTGLVENFETDPASESLDVAISLESVEQEQVTGAVTGEDPADLVIAPDVWLEGLLEGKEPRPFGENRLVIAVPPGNPAGVEDVAAFDADAEANTTVCVVDPLIANLVVTELDEAGVEPAEVSTDCEGTIDEVRTGALDAALVFRTVAATAGDDVEQVEVPDDQNVVFPISYLTVSDDPTAAALVAYLESDASVLLRTEAGYLP